MIDACGTEIKEGDHIVAAKKIRAYTDAEGLVKGIVTKVSDKSVWFLVTHPGSDFSGKIDVGDTLHSSHPRRVIIY